MKKISHDSETPAHGQQIISACALIHHNFGGVTKVFLAKRAVTKKFLPAVWEIPGGHIDFGEDIVAGLQRELQEEFDMRVSIGDPFAAFTHMNDIKGSQTIEVIYFAQFEDPIEQIQLNPEDHSDYDWFAKDELHKVYNDIKGEGDPEIQALRKAFVLLNGSSPQFV